MKEALVFGGHNSLDFSDIRYSVLRIPEVSLRLEQAQEIWDEECGNSFSFHHFLSSDDPVFFNNINLKSLSLAVVQLGLLDRYKRLFREPSILVGNTQNDSALLVATGQITFRELISQSRACTILRPMAPLQEATQLVLNGQALPQYQAFVKSEVTVDLTQAPYKTASTSDMNLHKVVHHLMDQKEVRKVIHVGPGSMDKSIVLADFQNRDVQIFESIDIDPMLGWFWADLRKNEQRLPIAQ